MYQISFLGWNTSKQDTSSMFAFKFMLKYFILLQAERIYCILPSQESSKHYWFFEDWFLDEISNLTIVCNLLVTLRFLAHSQNAFLSYNPLTSSWKWIAV